MTDEPWSEANARVRLRRLAPALPVAITDEPAMIPSFSNDVWALGDVILRVCWRGAPERLLREAVLGAAAPAAVGYPEVLGSGAFEGMAWTLTRRVAGRMLHEVWHDPDRGRVRAVIAHLGERLRALHAWTPTGEAASALRAHAAARPVGVEAIIGQDVVPLPLERSAGLLDAVKALDHVDPAVVDAAWARMRELARFDPFDSPGEHVAHCDATYPNVLVEGDRVSALLDLEWARLGPSWLELPGWTRLLEDLRAEGANPPPLLEWLQVDYPEVFAGPNLRERLWLCELAFTLRHVLFWPPDAPEDRLIAEHPLHRLRRLIDAPIPWS